MSVSDLSFDYISQSDLAAAFSLESACFPPSEAATLSSLTYRQSNAPLLFLGVFTPTPRTLIAFTCSTLTPSPHLEHDSMSTHVPGAPYAAIHSVCVQQQYRRMGVALALLNEYKIRLAQMGLKGARLITHDELIPLYQQAGFGMVGESSVVHGERKWFEMKIDFGLLPQPKEEKEKEKVAVVEKEAGVRSPGKAWESFGSIEELVGEGSALGSADTHQISLSVKVFLRVLDHS
ncbi:arylalkylamine N-acetyltransferase, partial [Phenoliferia sp. Uapishka_3]